MIRLCHENAVVRRSTDTVWGIRAWSSVKAGPRSVPMPLTVPMKLSNRKPEKRPVSAKPSPPSADSSEIPISVRRRPSLSAQTLTTSVPKADAASPAVMTIPIWVAEKPARER